MTSSVRLKSGLVCAGAADRQTNTRRDRTNLFMVSFIFISQRDSSQSNSGLFYKARRTRAVPPAECPDTDREPQQATTFDHIFECPEQLRFPRCCARDGRTPETIRFTAFGGSAR